MHQTYGSGGSPVIMNSPRKLIVTLVSLFALVANIVFAQDDKNRQKPKDQSDNQVLETLNVRLPITVKEKNGFIEGLQAANFEVYEDGKRQRIENFEAPSQLPFRIALLIDVSNSVKLKLPFEKDAAEDFVVTVTTFRKKDQVLIASFGSEVELHQDFTDNNELLVKAIRKLKSGGYTKLYDGVYRVIEEKMATIKSATARLIMVIISDGADTASEHTLKDAIEIAQKYDVTIFGISTKNISGISAGQVEGEDDKELRQLCEQTGGQIFLPSQKVELFRAFTEVRDDLRKEYVVYYTPTNQNKTGKRRKIEVKLRNAKGELFHKQGYVY